MDERELKARTKQFALRVFKLAAALPRRADGWAIASQLIRSGTSAGANYRAACRGRSRADFINKLGIAEEEADESAYWMELIIEGELVKADRVQPLLDEASQLVAIFSRSRTTAKASEKGSKRTLTRDLSQKAFQAAGVGKSKIEHRKSKIE